jgi:hypothetical protein
MSPTYPLAQLTFPTTRDRRLRAGLPLMLEAFDDAQELGRDVWEFALGAGELVAAGLATTDLRWLVATGHAEHARERLGRRGGARDFLPAPALAVTGESCYVLTPGGARFAAARLAELAEVSEELFAARSSAPIIARPSAPNWDSDRRELAWGGIVVKRFRLPAANQEVILSAFQEDGWPARIDDPLPQDSFHSPPERLREAVRGLNRAQSQPLLRFGTDGTGRGVTWGPAGR